MAPNATTATTTNAMPNTSASRHRRSALSCRNAGMRNTSSLNRIAAPTAIRAPARPAAASRREVECRDDGAAGKHERRRIGVSGLRDERLNRIDESERIDRTSNVPAVPWMSEQPRERHLVNLDIVAGPETGMPVGERELQDER